MAQEFQQQQDDEYEPERDSLALESFKAFVIGVAVLDIYIIERQAHFLSQLFSYLNT